MSASPPAEGSGSLSPTAVVELEAGRVPEVVDVLCEAFFDYPVMRYVVGADATDYPDRLFRLIGLFVRARVLRGEPLLGVEAAPGLTGAAIVSYPGRSPTPDAFGTLAGEVWDRLGSDARTRYDAFASACAPFQVERPHLHLNMIGVRREAQRVGIGSVLIERVHEMSRRDEQSVGVSLTTEDARNVPMYEHLGYEIVGHAQVAEDLETWGFFRPD